MRYSARRSTAPLFDQNTNKISRHVKQLLTLYPALMLLALYSTYYSTEVLQHFMQEQHATRTIHDYSQDNVNTVRIYNVQHGRVDGIISRVLVR